MQPLGSRRSITRFRNILKRGPGSKSLKRLDPRSMEETWFLSIVLGITHYHKQFRRCSFRVRACLYIIFTTAKVFFQGKAIFGLESSGGQGILDRELNE